jgi:predicted TPR repeat methyltransferase
MACLAEAVRADPRNHGFRLALAHTLDQAGQLDAAEATLEAGIALAPDAALPLWSAAARRAIALGDFGKALALCRAARGAGVVDPCLLGMQAHALSSLGEHDAAADAYEEALQLAPEDSYVRHLVAASGRRPPEPRAPADYVRVVFDGYANRFDEHIFSLGYRVPGLIRAALLAHADLSAEARLGPVLDLGCGTGLTALALSDLPLGPWHGIDISAAMLRCARRKGLYESLIEAPLPEGLAAPSPPCALALAGDLCCYFGELSALFEATRHRLRPGGRFIASLEAAPADCVSPWVLQPSGRYAHRADTVRSAAEVADLDVVSLEPDWLRLERGAPVPGFIAVLGRGPD